MTFSYIRLYLSPEWKLREYYAPAVGDHLRSNEKLMITYNLRVSLATEITIETRPARLPCNYVIYVSRGAMIASEAIVSAITWKKKTYKYIKLAMIVGERESLPEILLRNDMQFGDKTFVLEGNIAKVRDVLTSVFISQFLLVLLQADGLLTTQVTVPPGSKTKSIPEEEADIAFRQGSTVQPMSSACTTRKRSRTGSVDSHEGHEREGEALHYSGGWKRDEELWLQHGTVILVVRSYEKMISARHTDECRKLWSRLPDLLWIEVPGWGEPAQYDERKKGEADDGAEEAAE
ncbi:hypothetical protein C8Q74DRAFT_1222254 [Fomes fomentarius]|nr:hypothetical protein C8Q74DRAFT_1222254 [Fomes fomentarius]